jgi:hypothetical protein
MKGCRRFVAFVAFALGAVSFAAVLSGRTAAAQEQGPNGNSKPDLCDKDTGKWDPYVSLRFLP